MSGVNTKSSRFRFFVLLLAILVSSLLIYQIALKVTINLMSENYDLANKLETLTACVNASNSLEQDSFKRYFLTSDSSQFFKSNLFSEIEKITASNNVEIVNYYSMNEHKMAIGSIKTQKAELSGDYISLLNSLQSIENLELRYKLNSIRFYTLKSIKTKRSELVLELYFQILVKN